jgi:hypothetical protein
MLILLTWPVFPQTDSDRVILLVVTGNSSILVCMDLNWFLDLLIGLRMFCTSWLFCRIVPDLCLVSGLYWDVWFVGMLVDTGTAPVTLKLLVDLILGGGISICWFCAGFSHWLCCTTLVVGGFSHWLCCTTLVVGLLDLSFFAGLFASEYGIMLLCLVGYWYGYCCCP